MKKCSFCEQLNILVAHASQVVALIVQVAVDNDAIDSQTKNVEYLDSMRFFCLLFFSSDSLTLHTVNFVCDSRITLSHSHKSVQFLNYFVVELLIQSN